MATRRPQSTATQASGFYALLRWCDALEARLTAARTTATHLLDATLHQILTA